MADEVPTLSDAEVPTLPEFEVPTLPNIPDIVGAYLAGAIIRHMGVPASALNETRAEAEARRTNCEVCQRSFVPAAGGDPGLCGRCQPQRPTTRIKLALSERRELDPDHPKLGDLLRKAGL